MPNPYKIDEAAEFILDFGVKFSETGAGAEVLRMAREYAKLQEARIDAPRMPVNETVGRKEDMSVNGRLCLFKQDDGDICVSVIEDSGESAGIEFCTVGMGGGKSGRTLAALNELALAMIEDNKADPVRAAVR